ncbi:MAG: MATE family efflux transporter [Oscillospiraceae bacterium]|nr:MATE family efflux transporter [Candidatus Equicaccousia limihippi]
MKNKDLTVGKPSTVLFAFCLPLLGSVIFQQLYNIADSLVAGKFISENALTAVGNSYEITLIFIALAFGCNMGCSVVVSKLFGEKNIADLKSAVYTTFISTAVLCAVLMTAGLIFCDPLLRLINTPQSIFDNSALYLVIYILGVPFVFFYNVCNGIFTALGDSKTPFIFLSVSAVANIAIDIIFVTALRPVFTKGVDGVAWATFICQGISCVLAVTVVIKRLSNLKTEKKPKLFSWKLFKKITSIAVPSALQQSFVSVGNIVLQGIINGFGASVVAGYSAGIKLNNFIVTTFVTLGNGMSNFTAQNLGAKKPYRIPAGYKAGLLISVCLAVPITLLYCFAGKYLIMLFMNDMSGEAAQVGITLLRIISPFYAVISVKILADGILRGNEMMSRFLISTFCDLLLRVAIAAILCKTALGATGIWLAWPIGWVVSTVISFVFYKNCKFEDKSKIGNHAL